MEGSSSRPLPSSALSNLLCREDKSYSNEHESQLLNSQMVPYFLDLVCEDDYLQMLVQKERNSSSDSSGSSSNYPSWLKDSRFLAVNWILNAKDSFGFQSRTAYLSIIYLDRFLSRRYIFEHQAWAVILLGVACLSLAAKMHECKVPTLSEYQVPDFEFKPNVIQVMELLVLNTFEWNMGLITPFVFISYFAYKLCDQQAKLPDDLILRGTELIMASIKESNSIVDYRPFVVAVAAVMVASDWQLTQETLKLKIKTVPLWESSDNQQKQQEEEQLVSCYSLMQRLCAKDNPCTPNVTEVDQSATPSTSGTKRKLTFRDSEQNPDLPDDKGRG